ncbi:MULTISPECIES: lysylphosphatidylglycerol synthase transmembrane domain-containing protein [Anaeromyxobacter]|uniref:lysylphosphatidylglycerol synthase transmembrane domain-containing protein n=1 Tax=Anaeromyxobacter TaxID=161492 RepID=UPI001F572749|nr:MULTISPECIES: lysylphosphatidylglycerol synthase transmembrane domain-containing protein [unclassified Anaeromyxobacter]
MQRSSWERSLRVAAGLAVSAAALWLTLRNRDLGAIWRAARAADPRYLAAYLAILVASHFLRAARWSLLLEPSARIPFARVNAVSAVGFMATLILPLRLGELVRPALVADPHEVPLPAALSTVIVERVVDGLFSALVLVGTLPFLPSTAPGVALLRAGGWAVFFAFAGAVAFLAIAAANGAAAIRFAHRALDPLSPRVAARVSAVATTFVEGLRRLPRRRGLACFLALTVVFWALGGWSIAVLAQGFGFGLSSLQAFTVLGVLSVGMMIPAGPAMLGTFQASAVLGLSLVAPGALAGAQGLAFANVLWGAQLLQVVAMGVPFLFSRHVDLHRIGRQLGPVRTAEALPRE